MNGRVIVAVALSLAISWLACFVVRRWAPAWGLVDAPGGRKTHATPTPLGGGLAIGLSVAFTLLLIGQIELSTRLLAVGAAMLALGLADDRWGVSWKLRLAAELLLAGWFSSQIASWFSGSGDIGLPCAAVATLWIVAQLNAMNMLDNMDGLAAGVAGIAAAFLAAIVMSASFDTMRAVAPTLLGEASSAAAPPGMTIALVSARVETLDAWLPLAMLGALSGFLWHNRPPARLFMGDAGSYFVGFLLGAFSATAIALNVNRPWPAPFAPVCALLVPLYDMVSVVTIRLIAGRGPFAADRNHVSHRLAALGLDPRKAVLVLYAATFVTGVAALVVERASRAVGLTTIVGLGSMAGLAGVAEFLAHRKRTCRKIDHV